MSGTWSWGQGDSDLECNCPIKEVVGGEGSVLVVCLEKACPAGQLSAVSGDKVALRGTGPAASASPHDVTAPTVKGKTWCPHAGKDIRGRGIQCPFHR